MQYPLQCYILFSQVYHGNFNTYVSSCKSFNVTVKVNTEEYLPVEEVFTINLPSTGDRSTKYLGLFLTPKYKGSFFNGYYGYFAVNLLFPLKI